MDPDRYLIAAQGPETEIKVKGSRFLGQVFPVEDHVSVRSHLQKIKKKYYDATHHCWASRTGSPGAVESRSDDNGEPSGTAGAPIALVLERADWYSVLVVVTRYYGGTKLGTGGLAKAYGEAATRAMAATSPKERFLHRQLQVKLPFDDLGTIETLLAKNSHNLLHIERVFEDTPQFRLTLKATPAEAFSQVLVEATAGRVRLEWS